MADLNEPDWSAVAVPEDDGAAAHLKGMKLPDVSLVATDGSSVHLSELTGKGVLYIYPRTGRPGAPLPAGWDDIPGARGCTPQSCSFRDHYAELRAHGVDHLHGISTQDSDYQREAVDRLHLPFTLLSDQELEFSRAMRLPTFRADGMELIKRMSLIISQGMIEHVFYPVFPPDQDAAKILAYLDKAER